MRDLANCSDEDMKGSNPGRFRTKVLRGNSLKAVVPNPCLDSGNDVLSFFCGGNMESQKVSLDWIAKHLGRTWMDEEDAYVVQETLDFLVKMGLLNTDKVDVDAGLRPAFDKSKGRQLEWRA